ncbi:putative ABC transporter ATP-binding protein [bioreactor metagenome]|uniref:Putative ABC transporter ATP-binding protein n=1 Tax=bioreactor metagenome TaxID=1076179 RepID=A0A644WZ51_9ZZZZ
MPAVGRPGPSIGGGPRGFLTEEEKLNRPKLSKALLLRILAYLKPYKIQFVFVFAAILISAVIGLFPSLITGKIVDEALVGKDMALLIKLLLLALVTLTASQAIGVLQSYINSWISQRIIFDMQNQMYAHLQQMPHSFYTTEKQGDILTRMDNDISGVGTVITNTLTTSVANVAIMIATLIALFSLNWKMALIGIAIIPLTLIPARRVGQTRWKLLADVQAERDNMNQMLTETLSVSGSMLMKLFTREKSEYDRFVSVNERVTKLTLKEQRSGKWFVMILGTLSQIGPLLIYFMGGWLIISKTDTALTIGTITAMIALVNRLYGPVNSLLNLGVDFTRSLALFTRIFGYYDKEVTIKSKPDAVQPDLEQTEISFRHVTFTYEQKEPILKDISFTIPSGSMVAIVGPSGAGKSTIVNLLLRLYDVNAGEITVAGTDIRDFDLTYLRSNIGVVTQDAYLFNGTIRENLLYAKPDATQQEMEAACRLANIHVFIAAQEKGYDTMVGNRGLKLSGGEKQRISIARVALKNPKILVLDEATSSLDSISENAIQNALEAVMRGKTSVVIAHRLTTVLAADWILVVKDGIICEQGTHDRLLEQNGVYRELYETQFKRVLEHEGI